MVDGGGWEHPLLASMTQKEFEHIWTIGTASAPSNDFYLILQQNPVSRLHLWRMERNEVELLRRYPQPHIRPDWADPEKAKYVKLLVELLDYLQGRRRRRGQGSEQALTAVRDHFGEGSDAASWGKLMIKTTVQPTAYQALRAMIAVLDALASNGPDGLQAARRFARTCGGNDRGMGR
jgi:hypothetical protein